MLMMSAMTGYITKYTNRKWIGMLRFCFGASGSGKSTGLYNEVIKRSIEEPGKSFYIIVPDQFTMQTQKDVVKMHPSHAIMNIDVLSFGRLSHRIFEELSISSFSVLDDLGKSLVLRRVADILGAKLPIIGKNMHKPGYIDEVKDLFWSVILPKILFERWYYGLKKQKKCDFSCNQRICHFYLLTLWHILCASQKTCGGDVGNSIESWL